MRTREEYIEGLKQKNQNLWYDGKQLDRLDEKQLPAINVMSTTFDAAFDPSWSHARRS
jgi:aromatic ring hydroxylase